MPSQAVDSQVPPAASKLEAPIPQIGIIRLTLVILMVPATYVLVGLASLFAVAAGGGICALCILGIIKVRLHLKLLVILVGAAGVSGFAALTGIIAAFSGLWSGIKRPSTQALAIPVSLEHEKKLADFVLSLSREMKTRAPDNVLMEAQEHFWVTQVKTITGSGVFRGRTLVLAMPFLPFLTQQELRAILAHEVAHFTGRDTLYSVFVSPAFEGLAITHNVMREALDRYDGWYAIVAAIALWPPIAVLDACLRGFHRLDVSIQRKREIRADLIAARLCGSNVMCSALRKLYALSFIYPQFMEYVLRVGLPGRSNANCFSPFTAFVKDQKDLFKKIDREIRAMPDFPDGVHPSLKLRLHLVSSISRTVEDSRLPASALLFDIKKQETALTKMIYFQLKS